MWAKTWLPHSSGFFSASLLRVSSKVVKTCRRLWYPSKQHKHVTNQHLFWQLSRSQQTIAETTANSCSYMKWTITDRARLTDQARPQHDWSNCNITNYMKINSKQNNSHWTVIERIWRASPGSCWSSSLMLFSTSPCCFSRYSLDV